MPVLPNTKHEYFAQELAKGKSATEAYVLAGYKPNDGNAATLKGKQRISDRVAEIMERKAVRAEITVAMVTENLVRIAQKAEALAEASGFSVAKGAWETAAKLHGLMIERKEVRTGSLDELPADTIARVREQLIVARTGHLDSGGGPEASGKPH